MLKLSSRSKKLLGYPKKAQFLKSNNNTNDLNMKRILGTLMGIMILASCQDNSTQGNFKTMMIRSVGEVETLPNMASFQINLSCLKKSITEAKTCLVDKSESLHTQLLAFGIEEKDIMTSSVNMNKNYTYERSKRIFQGYQGSTRVNITIRDLDQLDEIYSALLENANLELSGLNYTHSKMDSLKNEAHANALTNAGMTADRLLKEIPASEKEILKMGNVQISASTTAANESRFADEIALKSNTPASSQINISKGTIKVNATMFVEYRIK